jgi:hypothetical protein
VLTNEGIGPARIETFELWWKGTAILSATQLLKLCCTPDPDNHQSGMVISLDMAAPRILRAGEHADFLSVALTDTNREVFGKFNGERHHIRTRTCYCSVFDECWIKEDGDEMLQKGQRKLLHPDSVKTCPAPAVPYQVTP